MKRSCRTSIGRQSTEPCAVRTIVTYSVGVRSSVAGNGRFARGRPETRPSPRERFSLCSPPVSKFSSRGNVGGVYTAVPRKTFEIVGRPSMNRKLYERDNGPRIRGHFDIPLVPVWENGAMFDGCSIRICRLVFLCRRKTETTYGSRRSSIGIDCRTAWEAHVDYRKLDGHRTAPFVSRDTVGGTLYVCDVTVQVVVGARCVHAA